MSDRSGGTATVYAQSRGRSSHGLCGRRDRPRGTFVDLYEYQGKQFFARYGIPVSPGEAVTTVDDAVAAAERVGYPVVVKAQVQVGGRGKAGGIKLANDADEVRTHAGEHPRHGHQGPHRRGRLDRARLRHRRGVLRQLHARPLGQEAPRACSRPRAASRSRRSPSENPDAIAKIWIDPVDGLTEAACPGVGRGGQAQPGGHRRRRRHPAASSTAPTPRATPTSSRSTR